MDSERDLICCGLELRFWPAAKKYLQHAIELNGAIDAEDVLSLIQQQHMQLWGIHDGDLKAVMVTEVVVYPKRKRLRVVLIGGHDMYLWNDVVIHTLEQFALEIGADAIEGGGRRGWVKSLEPFGFREYATIMIKELV